MYIVCCQRLRTNIQKLIYIPGANEIGPVQHDRLGERYLGLGVVAGEMVEAAHQRRPKYVRQVFAMDTALSL